MKDKILLFIFYLVYFFLLFFFHVVYSIMKTEEKHQNHLDPGPQFNFLYFFQFSVLKTAKIVLNLWVDTCIQKEPWRY